MLGDEERRRGLCHGSASGELVCLPSSRYDESRGMIEEQDSAMSRWLKRM